MALMEMNIGFSVGCVVAGAWLSFLSGWNTRVVAGAVGLTVGSVGYDLVRWWILSRRQGWNAMDLDA